jgi:hypothetical protein
MRYRGASGSRLPLILGAVVVIIAIALAWYLFFGQA